jgi:hypothetical protein
MKLRKQAEKRLLARDVDQSDMPLEDINELIHELQVHQIELEMQNEELRKSLLDLEAARDHFRYSQFMLSDDLFYKSVILLLHCACLTKSY